MLYTRNLVRVIPIQLGSDVLIPYAGVGCYGEARGAS